MRKPRVTRTMQGSVVTVKVVNRANSLMFDRTYALPRYYRNEQKLLKEIQSKLEAENPDFLPIRVVENVHKKFFCQMLEDKYFDEADKTELND